MSKENKDSKEDAARRRALFVENILHGADKSMGASAARLLLTLPSLLYGVGLEAYLLPFRVGLRQRYRLRDTRGTPVPTIAIGNLSSGGTGKTPMAHLAASGLKKRGYRVAILSRGHGGTSESSNHPRVVGDGFKTLISAQKAGDEPVLLADSLPGVPVVIGRDRRLSGDLVVDRFGPDAVLLDDALQYWQLHRDLDIILLDARRPFDNGFLLPRGLLREPPSHLARAGVVVITRADRVDAVDLERTIARVQRLARRAEVFTATHAPLGWVTATDRATLLPLDHLAGRGALLFSGIADNASFQASVGAQGVRVVAARAFPDHHAFSRPQVGDLAAEANRTEGVEVAITTEKDLVKAGHRWPSSSDAPPLYALRIGIQISDEARFLDILSRVAAGVSD